MHTCTGNDLVYCTVLHCTLQYSRHRSHPHSSSPKTSSYSLRCMHGPACTQLPGQTLPTLIPLSHSLSCSPTLSCSPWDRPLILWLLRLISRPLGVPMAAIQQLGGVSLHSPSLCHPLTMVLQRRMPTRDYLVSLLFESGNRCILPSPSLHDTMIYSVTKLS